MKERELSAIKVGMKVDIRDPNNIWCEGKYKDTIGIMVRIITRLDQPCRFLRINYLVKLLTIRITCKRRKKMFQWVQIDSLIKVSIQVEMIFLTMVKKLLALSSENMKFECLFIFGGR